MMDGGLGIKKTLLYGYMLINNLKALIIGTGKMDPRIQKLNTQKTLIVLVVIV